MKHGSVTENITRDACAVLGIEGLQEPINGFLRRIETHLSKLCGGAPQFEDLAYAAEYYYLFRRVHAGCEHLPVRSILAGDYFYSRFLQALNRIGRADISRAFADALCREAASGDEVCDEDAYLAFLKSLRQGRDTDAGGSMAAFLSESVRLGRDSLQDLDDCLTRASACENAAMREGISRILLAGGKRLRPRLCRICYSFGEEPKKPVLPLLYMLELMHNASLIHDDIIDEAPIRRGVPTIHETNGRCMAVMSGDYLLGRLMEALPYYYGTGINEEVASVAIRMCGGEFSQLDARFHIKEQTLSRYYVQIRDKTAYLLAISCSMGATAAGLPEADVRALYGYGEQIGIAFQIRDDMLDFTAEPAFGKEKAKDLRSGIYTLPFLYACRTCPDPAMIRLSEQEEKSEEEIGCLIDYTDASGGFRYAQEVIRDCSKKAQDCLAALPDGEAKAELTALSESLCERKR